jgi:hypothetical protein
MADLFISYRSDDSRSATGRLADRLQAEFGAERVFRDLDSIAPGRDFEAALDLASASARVLLAVVGPRWIGDADAAGRRRLDDPQDWVRREIETALAAGVPVIPVLVEGACMPGADALPASLAAFARCQAVELSDARWAEDTRRLVQTLRERHGIDPGDTAAPASPAAQVGAVWFDLVELVARPRRVIARLAREGGRREFTRAAVLLLLCLALGNLLLGSMFEIGLASFTFNGTLAGLLWSAGLIALAVLGWRVAGSRAGWQRIGAGAACVVGGLWLYVSAGLLLFGLGLALAEPSSFAGMLARVRSGLTLAQAAAPVLDGLTQGPAVAALTVATMVWLVGLAWLAAAWNALRLALGARVWQAAAAAVAVFVPLWLLGRGVTWVTGQM